MIALFELARTFRALDRAANPFPGAMNEFLERKKNWLVREMHITRKVWRLGRKPVKM
jgi:hypothetical protein